MIDPIDELELAELRSGRDEFSKLKLPALAQMRPTEATALAERLLSPEEQAAALRWVLRGLTVERAIAKVVLDRKLVEAIREKRRATKELRESLGISNEEMLGWVNAIRRGEL